MTRFQRRLLWLLPALTGANFAAGAADLDQEIGEFAASSSCAKTNWNDRGRAPAGFVKGIAVTYARLFCELRTSGETARLVAGVSSDPSKDALVWYAKSGGTDVDRLRAIHALAIGEGMRESSGNFTEGRDQTVKSPTAANAEAGLFQQSYDSMSSSKYLPTLLNAWETRLQDCDVSLFSEGIKDRHAPVVGVGLGADFQRLTKACPSFATEYALVMFRVNRQHFGPLTSKKAQLLPACEAMFRAIEPLAEKRCPPKAP